MKKLIVLTVLFLISLVIALGLVVNEQSRRAAAPSVLKNLETETGAGTSIGSTQATPTPAPGQTAAATAEGDISLTIISPQERATTKDAGITITGKTNPGASVMINEFELVSGADGTFSQPVTLDDGENYFSIVAYTPSGAVAERELTVIREVSGY